MKKIINADVIFGAVMLIIAIVFYVAGVELASIGLKGSIDAGFFPRALTIIIAIMSICMIVTGFMSPQKYFEIKEENKAGVRLIIGTIGIFGIYIGLWKFIHFIPLTLVFLLSMSWLLKLSWKFAIIYSIIMSCGLYYIFANVFRIILN
ncbi:MAG: tripartite tricarboxylate transporter TctB family protein [Anaerotignaceae bacterium]